MTIAAPSTDYHLFHADLPPTRTREDYHRFFLDPRTLPSTKIVGVLACQRDSYLRSLETTVIAARDAGEDVLLRASGVTAQEANAQPATAKAAKGGKNDQAKEKGKVAKVVGAKPIAGSDEVELWEVELKDTVLFPEGGGQPNDTGALVLRPESSEPIRLVVQDVFRRGLTALHVVQLPKESSEKDNAKQALAEGTPCEVTVDWERRYDQMTQHTAQHLLSAICDTHLELPTLSWFMPPFPSTEPCYIELPRSLTPEEAQRMEDICNKLVTNGWGVGEEEDDVKIWIESRLQKRGNDGSSASSGLTTPVAAENNAEQAEKDGLGLVAPMRGFGVHDEEQREWADRESRGLPKDYAGGVVRTAVIDGLDRNLCCGTHQPTLSKIGLIHVLAPTTASKKPTRLFMVAGHRAAKHLIAASHNLTKTSVVLGCAKDQVPLRVEQREQGRRDMLRNQDRTRQELAKALGSLVQWRGVDLAGEGVQWATVVRTEEATHDFEFMGSLNAAAVESLPQGDQANEAEKGPATNPRYAFILHSSIVSMANNGIAEAGSLLLITSNPPELAKQLGDKLKSELDSIEGQEKGRVKGGGAKGRWMGKITGKWSKADAAVLDKLESL